MHSSMHLPWKTIEATSSVLSGRSAADRPRGPTDASRTLHRRERRRAHPPRPRADRRRGCGHRAHPRACPEPPRAGHVRGHVVRALLLQVVAASTCAACPPRRRECWSARARTPAWSTSATASPPPSASRATTTRRPSSPTRARPPASAASSATSSPWAPAPSRCMDPLRFGPLDDPRSRWIAEGVVSGISRLRQLGRRARPSAARSSSTRPTPTTRSSTSCASASCPHERLVLGQASGVGQPGRAARLDHRARRHRRRDRAGLGRLRRRRRRRGQAPERAGRRPVRGEAPDRGVPRRCSTPAWSSASRTSAAPGSPAPPARRRRRGGVGMDVDVSAVPRREPGMEPFEVMTSECQERMLAIVEPADLDEVLAICAAVGGAGHRRRHRSPPAGALRILDRLDGEVLADVPAASLHEDAPLTTGPGRARRPGRPAGRRRRRPRWRRPPTPGADLLGLLADTVVGVVAVRPPAVPQHRRGPGRRRQPSCGSSTRSPASTPAGRWP